MPADFDKAAIAARIGLAIRRSGWSIPAAALVCGLPLPTIEGLVYRRTMPNAATLARLCVGLGVSADWVLFGEEVKSCR